MVSSSVCLCCYGLEFGVGVVVTALVSGRRCSLSSEAERLPFTQKTRVRFP